MSIAKVVSLSGNPIRDLEPLVGLRDFQDLDLRRTQIATIAPLVRNEDLELRRFPMASTSPLIDIRQNPQLDCVAEAANIAALERRDLTVKSDCP